MRFLTAGVLALALASCATVQRSDVVAPVEAAALSCEDIARAGLASRKVIEDNVVLMARVFANAIDVLMPATDNMGIYANRDALKQLEMHRANYQAKACPVGPFGGVPF